MKTQSIAGKGLLLWLLTSFLILTATCLNCWGQARIVDIANDSNDPSNLSDSEPSIAVNPQNTMEIAIMAFSESWGTGTSAPVWKSDDGGFTWRKVTQIGAPSTSLSGPGDQKIGFDAAGNIYVAELGSSPATDFIYRQTAGPDDPLTVGASYGDDQPHLDVDKGTLSGCPNQLYSPWMNYSLANPQSTVANSITGGAAMTSLAVGNNASFPNRTTRIALGPDGKVYVIYKTREGAVDANFETAHFYVRRSDDCGSTWNAIGGTSGIPVHGTTAVTTWFTNSFGNATKGSVGRARSSDAWIATNPTSGDVYAVYTNRDGSGFGQVFVTRSTTQGNTWSVPVRVTDGTHNSAYPEIAVTATGTVGVLYIDYDDSGAHTLFRHHFARSFDNGGSWTDETLQSEDPSTFTAGTFVDGFLWGDYEGLTASGKNFYGVFTGQSIGRATIQQDPIFFNESGVPAASDFYVRDWTTSPISHDNGEEPSTNPNWWTTGDVWNRLTNTNGGFNANDQPNHQDAQDAVNGHNYAFVRIHRKAAAAGGAPDVNVTARFLYADYGLGVPYQDVSATSTATFTFAAADTEKTLADGLGIQWDLPVTRSTHVCMAVEISAPGDPYFPELAGRAPGWPTTDWTLPADNNKAQKNMDLPAMGESAGLIAAYALVHNAATFSRTVTVRYSVAPEVLRKLEGAQIGLVGGDSQALRAQGILEVSRMEPGENRWISLNYSAPNAKVGDTIPVSLEEIVNGVAINGLTVAVHPAPLDAVIRENLKLHRAAFSRLDRAFDISRARRQAAAAAELLRKPSTTAHEYLAFLRESLPEITLILSETLESRRSGDVFAAKKSLEQLTGAVSSQDASLSVQDHAAFLNKLDAFQTMLQKAEGDPGDILQMVVWQRQLYSKVPVLKSLKLAKRVVEESDEFIKAFGNPRAHEDSYSQMIRELLKSFHETAESLEKMNLRLEPAVDEMEDHLKSTARLEKAHRNYLLKLDALPK